MNDYTWNLSRERDELAHYGILGMKWGVRRYQNYDGSLTAAGRKHKYSQSEFGEVASNYANNKISSKGSSSESMLSAAKKVREAEDNVYKVYDDYVSKWDRNAFAKRNKDVDMDDDRRVADRMFEEATKSKEFDKATKELDKARVSVQKEIDTYNSIIEDISSEFKDVQLKEFKNSRGQKYKAFATSQATKALNKAIDQSDEWLASSLEGNSQGYLTAKDMLAYPNELVVEQMQIEAYRQNPNNK